MRKLLLIFIFGILLAGSIYAGITISKDITLNEPQKEWLSSKSSLDGFSYTEKLYESGYAEIKVYYQGQQIGYELTKEEPAQVEKRIINEFIVSQMLSDNTEDKQDKIKSDVEGVITIK